VEVGEAGRREHVSHPPQVPDEAEVVAWSAWYRIAQMDGERPCPADGQSGKQCDRAGVELQRVPQLTLSTSGGTLPPWRLAGLVTFSV